MNKQYLDNVATAKESIKIWLSKIEQKHRGIQMFSKENDTDRENTEFFKWYSGEGQTFSSFEAFREIESHYHKMYDHFLAYTKLSKTPIKKTWFSNNTEKRKTELNSIYKKIEFSSVALIEQITFFENNLIESPLFRDISNPAIPEVEEVLETETEDIFKIVDEITPKSYENPVVEEDKSIAEKADENLKEEPTIPIDEKKPIEEEPLFEIDPNDEVLEEEIAREEEMAREEEIAREEEMAREVEKKAILEIPKESEKKQEKDNNKILPDIDIEEEIRRILS